MVLNWKNDGVEALIPSAKYTYFFYDIFKSNSRIEVDSFDCMSHNGDISIVMHIYFHAFDSVC